MTVEAFEFYVQDSAACRLALAELYVAWEAFMASNDTVEKGVQALTIKEEFAKVGYP